MASMNWDTLDLNLLVVFDADIQERNLTRAGGRLGMSPPAMSHAMARLRHALNDELFVRTPEGMRATPRAQRGRGKLDLLQACVIGSAST
jgi:DNA-binding transcriptional LysR family regulator